MKEATKQYIDDQDEKIWKEVAAFGLRLRKLEEKVYSEDLPPGKPQNADVDMLQLVARYLEDIFHYRVRTPTLAQQYSKLLLDLAERLAGEKS